MQSTRPKRSRLQAALAERRYSWQRAPKGSER
jgi:hypothetical protein